MIIQFLFQNRVKINTGDLTEKKRRLKMKKQLSLVELATYGYMPTRVNKGSWLEHTFGKTNNGVENNECIRQLDQNKDKHARR